jgi:SPP1 gp7 family putative phage head morphogenesis protein
MCEITTYKISADLQKHYDPTKTTSLRNLFASKMKQRFVELQKVVKTSIVDNDCFGLKREKLALHQMVPASKEAFNFIRSSEKIEAFMVWLQQQVDKGILDVRVFQQVGGSIEGAWTNLYIYDSYKRGVLRAMTELKKAGFDIPENQLQISMNNPFHVDRVGLLFIRVYSDLKGITDAMDSQISRILAQGVADGDGPALIARKIISTINGDGADKLGITDTLGRFVSGQRRAVMLARTEIIRSFAEAQLQEFENWGILGVSAEAEWQTAQDDRVCPICEHMQGKIFTIEEARGKIPAHPHCRCCWLPYIKELEKYKK